jgi:hypothetical protein
MSQEDEPKEHLIEDILESIRRQQEDIDKAKENQQSLSSRDIELIIKAITAHELGKEKRTHQCRFAEVQPDTLVRALNLISSQDFIDVLSFMKSFHKTYSKTGLIIWTTLVVSGIGGLIGLIGYGIIAKIEQIKHIVPK